MKEAERREREQKDRERKERERQEAEFREKENEERERARSQREQQDLLTMVETKRSDWMECLHRESWSTSEVLGKKDENLLQVSAFFFLALVSITGKILSLACNVLFKD